MHGQRRVTFIKEGGVGVWVRKAGATLMCNFLLQWQRLALLLRFTEFRVSDQVRRRHRRSAFASMRRFPLWHGRTCFEGRLRNQCALMSQCVRLMPTPTAHPQDASGQLVCALDGPDRRMRLCLDDSYRQRSVRLHAGRCLNSRPLVITIAFGNFDRCVDQLQVARVRSSPCFRHAQRSGCSLFA